MLVAIETSCDETAIALFELGQTRPLAEKVASQIDLHVAYGGVVPELAARQHIKALPLLWQQLFDSAGVTQDQVSAIAVTVGPGLQGCLLVGVSFAKAVCQALQIPLIPVHHIEGHIAATALSETEQDLEYPAIALVVSGGHTMIVEVTAFRKYRLLSETRDDAAGEAFDKIASALSLPYPGGPSLSKLATQGDDSRFSFPIAVADDPKSFSFSGLKTAVQRVVTALSDEDLEVERANIAASAQRAIVDALVKKVFDNLDTQRHRDIIVTGGVAANGVLRAEMQRRAESAGLRLHIPPIRYCTDNAAMIGVIAVQMLENSADEFREWDSSKSLGPSAEFEIGARARFPFHELVS